MKERIHFLRRGYKQADNFFKIAFAMIQIKIGISKVTTFIFSRIFKQFC